MLGKLVRRAMMLPSAAEILYSSALPSKDSVATMVLLFSQAGPVFSPGRSEMWRARPPLAETTHKSAPPRRYEVNAIWPPEGESAGRRHCDFICVTTFISDRKSTRLNSSHLGISYAVFC